MKVVQGYHPSKSNLFVDHSSHILVLPFFFLEENKMIKYQWIAKFDDGKVIKQFDGSQENLFSLVENNMKHLVKFTLSGNNENHIIDLQTGEIFHTGETDNTMKGQKNLQLIYMRRNKVRINPETGESSEKEVIFRAGLKNAKKEHIFELV